jgi:hypothetical protein
MGHFIGCRNKSMITQVVASVDPARSTTVTLASDPPALC